MALHFEISEIRLARKANDRVEQISPGPHPLAGFDLTTEGGGLRKDMFHSDCKRELAGGK